MDQKLGDLDLNPNGKEAIIKIDDEFDLKLYLAESLSNVSLIKTESKKIIANYNNENVRLEITFEEHDELIFYNFQWYGNIHYLKDTIYLGNLNESQWYGGADILQQQFPIYKTESKNLGYEFCPYVVMDPYLYPASGHERYWLSSKKIGIYVPLNIPLWTKISNNGYLSLQSQFDNSLYQTFKENYGDTNPFLSYTIIITNDKQLTLKDFHLRLSKIYSDHPRDCIDDLLIEKPIWTTWARYGKKVNQNDVLKFAEEIEEHGFNISQIELDDQWTTEYGDFEIDEKKFPSFKEMTKKLESKGIRLTAWIHPFINVESKNGKNSNLFNLFVLDYKTKKPRTTKWWNGTGYIVDFTNPTARAWFKGNLERLKKEYGIYSYKFDAGEVSYLPEDFSLTCGSDPNDFSRCYSHFASEFGNSVEDRVGSMSQAHPVMVRTLDRLSRWVDTGLATLIPSALHFSLHGYYWNLPDIIGGNGYEMSEIGDRKVRTDSELFIRWIQANAFLLVLQFSFCPWDYKEAKLVEDICHSVLQQREKRIEYIKEECRKSVNFGIPLIRPLWWEYDDKDAYLCDDQFFVGDRLMVAPVLKEKMTTRKVIIPSGQWIDDKGEQFKGPDVIEIDTPLERIPHFWKSVESKNCSIM